MIAEMSYLSQARYLLVSFLSFFHLLFLFLLSLSLSPSLFNPFNEKKKKKKKKRWQKQQLNQLLLSFLLLLKAPRLLQRKTLNFLL